MLPKAIPGPPRQLTSERWIEVELPLKAMQSSPALYVKLRKVMSLDRYVSALLMRVRKEVRGKVNVNHTHRCFGPSLSRLRARNDEINSPQSKHLVLTGLKKDQFHERQKADSTYSVFSAKTSIFSNVMFLASWTIPMAMMSTSRASWQVTAY